MRVDVEGELPPTGTRAVQIVRAQALEELDDALTLTQQTITRNAPRGGAGRTDRDINATGDGIEGSVFPTDFRWRFYEFGTGLFNPKRKTVIGPKRGRRAKGSNRRGAIKLADGRVVASVKGIQPTAFIRKARREVLPRVERDFEEAGLRIVDRLAKGR